ncbi:hypothetical protein [Pedobacter sp. Leaf170]|uniref:hypothetical protein n=1 Tax=Pedobacter sp. Leaf170 TaxID=2876558 RepID=UPI001E2A0826|nr:hypothetical protein [Pedobacter sp. Leaf170]
MENNKYKYGRFEDVPEKSKVQILNDEIEMVRKNRFLSEQERTTQIRKIEEARKEYE